MSASLKIDLTQVPFSARGSFLAVSQLPAHWQGLPNAAGLYLRTVRHDVQTPLIAQISLPDEEFDAAIEHAGLTLTGASFRVECCFAENYDALTGEGLRDRAYTWTASTAMILVREILSMNR